MKIRPVSGIHVAAYLFSALVLGVSAVSHHRWIHLDWYRCGTVTRLIAYDGDYCVQQPSHLQADCDFLFNVSEPFHTWTPPLRPARFWLSTR